VLVGQSLELWRPSLSAALARGDVTAVVARAARQLAAGAHALDLNVGVAGGPLAVQALCTAATAIRTRWPAVWLWLDCGDAGTLASPVAGTSGPRAANALRLDAGADDDTHTLLEACATAGVAVVWSPDVTTLAETDAM